MPSRNSFTSRAPDSSPSNQLRRGSDSDFPEELAEPRVTKRRRIALACTSCRQRKSRCNGAQPKCSLCTELGIRCVYEQPTKPTSRRLPAEYDDRLQSIEATLRRLVQHTSELQGDVSRQEADTGAINFHQDQDNGSQDLALVSDGEIQPPEIVEDTIDGMAAVTSDDGTDSRFFGSSSNIAFLKDISSTTSAAMRTVGASQQRSNSGMSQPLVSRPPSPIPSVVTPVSASRSPVNTRLLPPEHRAVHLLKLYFSDTGSMFPFIDEQHVLESYHTFKAVQFSGITPSWLCLFNSIFAFATYISATPEQSVSKNAAESEVFFNRALALSSSTNLRLTNLETVQYLLLMSQYCQGTQRPDETWTLHGLAVRAAINLGLHSASRSKTFSPRLQEVRKRVWFGCFTLDRTLSMTFGRPPTIPDCLVSLALPIEIRLEEIDGPAASSFSADNTRRPNTASFFIVTIKLYKILGTIIANLYGQNISEDAELPLPVAMQEISTIEQKLSEWRNSLPQILLLRPWEGQVTSELVDPNDFLSFARLSVVTRLRYLNTRILLHRLVLSNMLRGQFTSEGGFIDDRESYFDHLAKSSIRVCHNSAIEVIDIVHSVSQSRSLLGAWWFSLYYTFNASLVVFSCLLLALNQSQIASFHDALDNRPLDSESLSELATGLRRAIVIVERMRNDTRPAKSIHRTLVKLVKICATLARSNPIIGPAVLAALSPRDTDDTVPPQGSSTHTHGLKVNNAMQRGTITPAPSYYTFDMMEDMSQYAIGADMNLFADLGLTDSGLVSLMTA